MEKEKAIEIFNRQINCYKTDREECVSLASCSHCNHNVTPEELTEAMQMAISALQKQETAKIVVGKSRGGVTLWHECSKCGEPVDAKDIFCRRCGRKLIPLPEPYTEEES